MNAHHPSVLLVDDMAENLHLLTEILKFRHFTVRVAYCGKEAIATAHVMPPDIILLDIKMPDMDGYAVCRELQADERTKDIPIIFVTARRREFDEVLGLELGADGYITKPFNPDVLLARVKSVLRRTVRSSPALDSGSDQLSVGDLIIDPAAHTVTIAGETVHLTAREFDVLHTLALDAGKVVSIDDLIARVWGAEFAGETQGVYVHIRWLREKIEKDPKHHERLVNVRGKGYKLVPQSASAKRHQ